MSTQRSRAIRLLAIAFMLATMLAALAGPAVAADGEAFVAAANVKRQENGRAPVSWHAAVDQVTVERGNQMAANDTLAHDMAYVERRLRELGVCFTGYGEIIYWERGYPSFDPQRAVDAWYRSTSGHKEIMLGDYNAAGGSWTQNPTSRGIFAVMVWVKICGVAPPPPPPPPAGDPGESVRVAGADRYATAAALSAANYAPGVPVAYVATGASFPDALAAGPAAAHTGGPVLLVKQNEIPAVTASELSRLRPGRIVVLGGWGAISDATANGLIPFAISQQVSRIAGSDRFTTAAMISQAHFASGTPVVYVATGANFPDALAGGAAAGMQDGPILLVKPNELPAATAAELQRLHPTRIVVLGSAAIVSDAVAQAMGAVTGAQVSRTYGADRYATAVAISQANYAANGPSTVYVATGANFPDGLAGSPVAGSLPGPMLLVPSNSLPGTVAAELQRLAPDTVVILGGSGAISDGVVGTINAVIP
jgi:putative cell wall-binding protein/uncharacterized protein YkwD